MSALPPLASTYRTVTVVVLDGLGIGSCRPDSSECPANTLGSVALAHRPTIPNLLSMGLADFVPASPPVERTGSSARLIPLSPGKDTLTGHWELAGVVTDLELRTFPEGFPAEFMEELRSRLGHGLLGGWPASGTNIIEQLGPQHLSSGKLIVYTSADSVLQIAAHQDVVPAAELYRLCGIAREVAAGPFLVGRVIARPFQGPPGAFVRAGRRDFSLIPPGRTVLETAEAAGIEVIAIGKVAEVFANRGVSRSVSAANNDEAMLALAATEANGAAAPPRLVFANLNDFDSLYGHRRDASGFAGALEAFDRFLPRLLPRPGSGHLLVLTADHGCDPTAPGTDHTREDVPLLVAGTGWVPSHLGTIDGLTAVSGLVSAAFGLEGFSFWPRRASGGYNS